MFICTSYAQSLDTNGAEVTSVAGIKFGLSKYSFKSEMHERFSSSYYEEDGNIITVDNISVGQLQYDYAEFYFKDDKFVAASLVKSFPVNNFQAAKNYRDDIADRYCLKYRNMNSFTGPDKIKFYLCGKPEIKGDTYSFPIRIELGKYKSRKGIYRYYVSVHYFKFRMFDAMNEDI